MELYLILFLAGLIGGLLAGFMGIGGGIIYIFVLPIALSHLGIPEQEIAQYTIANSIFGTFFAALMGTINHMRNKEFFGKDILIIGVLGVVSSLLTLHFFVNTTLYSQDLFNLVIVALFIFMLYSTLRNAKRQLFFKERTQHKNLMLGSTGIASGLISALSGLGGGVVIIPFLNTLLKYEIRKAKAISLGVILITSTAMIIFNMTESPENPTDIPHVGYLLFQITGPMVLGVVLTSAWGVKLSRKVKSSTISYIFAAFIIIVIARKIIELVG